MLIPTGQRVLGRPANPFHIQLPLRCGGELHVHNDHPASGSRSGRCRKIAIQTGELAEGISRRQDAVPLVVARPVLGAGHFSEVGHCSGSAAITRFCWLGLMQPVWKKTVIAGARIMIRPFMCPDRAHGSSPAKESWRSLQITAPQGKPRVCSTCFA